MNFLNKFGYLICLIVYFNYITDVIKLKNKVDYNFKYRSLNFKDDEFPKINFCVDLYLNKTGCKQLAEKVEFRCDLFLSLGCKTKGFEKLKINEIYAKIRTCKIYHKFKNTGSKKKELKPNEFLYNGHYCFNFDDSLIEEAYKSFQRKNSFSLHLPANELKIFMNSKKNPLPLNFKRYSYVRKCNLKTDSEIMMCQGVDLVFQKRLIYNLKRPFESQCRDYGNGSSREQCLLDCNRKMMGEQNLNNYHLLYNFNESIYLNLNKNEIHNYTICNEQCSEQDCETSFYQLKSSKSNSVLNEIKFIFENDVQILEAKPSFNLNYLMIHVFGLFSNLFGITIFGSLKSVLSKSKRKLQIWSKRRFRLNQFKFNKYYGLFLIFVYSLLFLIAIWNSVKDSIDLIENYLKYDTIRTDFLAPLSLIKFNLFICFAMFNTVDYSNNSTLFDLNKSTKNASELILDFYITRNNEKEFVNYNFNRVLFFKNRKCFGLSLEYEPKLDQILKNAKLNLKSKGGIVYIEKNGSLFNSKSTEFKVSSTDFVVKRNHYINNSNQTYCLSYDYRSKYINCKRQLDCIEQCVQRKYIENELKTIDNFVVNLELYPDEMLKKIKYHTAIEDMNQNEYFKNCSNEFKIKDCRTIQYESRNLRKSRSDTFTMPFYMPRQITEYKNKFKNLNLIYGLISIINIWFDFSLPLLLGFFSNFLERLQNKKFRNRTFINLAKFRILFRSMFVIICIYNLNLILQRLLANKIVTKSHFEIPSVIELPKITVCTFFSKNYNDERFQNFTGHDLNSFAINFTDVVERIIYLDDHYRQSSLEADKVFSLNSPFVQVQHFFYQNFRCFEILIFYKYHTKYMPSFFKKTLVKIKFNSNRSETIISAYLSPKNDFNIHSKFIVNRKKVTEVLFAKSSFEYRYKFKYLQNPLSIFRPTFQSQSSYLDYLRDQFVKKYNLTTCKIPLTKNYLNFKIDDKLFQEFIKDQTVLEPFQELDHLEFHKEINFYDNDDTYLKIKPIFLSTKVTFESELTYNELFFFILSELSLWLNFCFLDFIILIAKSCFNILFINLLNFMNRLINVLNYFIFFVTIFLSFCKSFIKIK